MPNQRLPVLPLSARLIVAAFAIVIAMLSLSTGALAMGTGRVILETDGGPYTFTVEVTETPNERAMGLMFRRALGRDEGMIFLYEEPQPLTMWMKNTHLSLDMVFIGPDWRVNRIAERTEPFSLDRIPSNGNAIGVLEVVAGTAKRIGLKIGDPVIFEKGDGAE